MEINLKKETKPMRLNRYLSQMTKNGIMSPEKASVLSRQYAREKNIGVILDQLVMLPVTQEKEEKYNWIIDAIFKDDYLN